jgi:uncharacterized protein YdaU (DUF1376 family)
VTTRDAIGGNGGPPLDDRDIKLQFIQFNLRDILETIRTMPLAERGYYLTALFVMYERGGMLPDDDKIASMSMGIDVRQYRHMKPKMIETGRFRETAFGLTNDRAQAEIAIATRKIRAAQDAGRAGVLAREAKKREERSRIADAIRSNSDEQASKDRREIEERSPRDRREIDERSTRSVGDTPEDFSEKPNKINGAHEASLKLIDIDIDKDKERERKRTHAPIPDAEDLGSGVFANGLTVAHKRFSISLKALEAKIFGAYPDAKQAAEIARREAIAHALQWAGEIDAGRIPDVVRNGNLVNVISGSIMGQKNRRDAAAAKPSPKQIILRRH